MATTEVCRYDPAAAWAMPFKITKAKKTPGEDEIVVERVSSPTRTARIEVDEKVRRDGEDYGSISNELPYSIQQTHQFGRHGRMCKETEVGNSKRD